MTEPLFFFSYSRTDGGKNMDRFFRELRAAVYVKSGLRNRRIEEIAFRDEANIALGDNWSNELCTALNTSRIIICNYSPSYFESEYCGKEIAVFQKRVNQLNENDRNSVIIPILWETPGLCNIPQSLSHLQYSHGSLCASYKEQGLHWIIKLKREKDFQGFIDALAVAIVKTSTLILPPMKDEINLAEIPSAFLSTTSQEKQHAGNLGGPKKVNFVFVAGKKKDLVGVRNNLDSYGDGEEDWRPFNQDDDIGLIAQNVVDDKRLRYNHIPVDENFIKTIKDAEKKNSTVIIIVDPWSLGLSLYKTSMEQYDQTSFLNSELLVSWNVLDPETSSKQEKLKTSLRETLLYCVFGARADFKGIITSQNELKAVLGVAIEEARARLMKYAETPCLPNYLENKTSIPVISGPQ